jgi:hypothetical protein
METVQSDFPQVTQSFVGCADDLDQQFNVANLFWKMTGIGREKWNNYPEQMKAQLMPSAQGSMGQFANQLIMSGIQGIGASQMASWAMEQQLKGAV